MTDKPEALRLADDLQEQAVWEALYGPSRLRDLLPEAAAELRRLHAVNAELLERADPTQTPCDTAEDGVCEVIDCCRNSTQEEQEPTVRIKCTVVDDRHPNGVPFEQWVNAPQQEQEPYCYIYEYDTPFGLQREFYPREYIGRKPDRTVPLYTHPPHREWHPLTDKEIRRMGIETPGQQGGWNLAFARAVERALKEKNNG